MKTLFTLLLSLGLAITTLVAQQSATPEPGVYRGYISITRSHPTLKIKDVTTMLISGRLYINDLDEPTLDITPRTLHGFAALANLWSNLRLKYDELQNQTPDIHFGNGNPMYLIPAGTTVPGSLKLTANSMAWKSTSQRTDTPQSDTHFSVTFSITRTGPTPTAGP